MLDEADALSNADLLLLRQLGGQSSLTGRGVVHGHVSLLLVTSQSRPTGQTLDVQKQYNSMRSCLALLSVFIKRNGDYTTAVARPGHRCKLSMCVIVKHFFTHFSTAQFL